MFNNSNLGNCGWIPHGQPDCQRPPELDNIRYGGSEFNQQFQAAQNDMNMRINADINAQRNFIEQQQRENAERERVDRENQARLAQEEAARQAHEVELRRQEHEKWAAQHPLEAAEQQLANTTNHLSAMEHNKNHAEHLVRESEQRITNLKNEYSKFEIDYGIKLRNLPSSAFLIPKNIIQIKTSRFKTLNHIDGQIHQAIAELNQRRVELDHYHRQLHEAIQGHSAAKENLSNVRNHIRQQQEAHAAHLAQQEAQKRADEAAAAQRKADEAAETQRQADAAKLKEQQEAQRKTEEAARVVKELIATRSVQNANSLVVESSLPSVPAMSLHQLTKDVAQTAGQLSGVVVSGVETLKGIKDAIEDPVGAGKALYQFAITDNKIDKINNALAEKLDHIKLEEAKDTIAGSFNAGFEKAKLETDVASLAVGVPGVAKFGATGVQKVASLVGPAQSIPIAGTSFTIPGRVLGEYSTIKTGPLDPLMAGNFSGGRYKEIILKEDVILYRAGTSDVPKGQYYSMDKPMGVVQSRIDKAILPEWPTGDKSIINTVFETKVAKGTKVYLGEVGAQESIYVGGTHQIVIPQAWKNPGVEVISKEILE